MVREGNSIKGEHVLITHMLHLEARKAEGGLCVSPHSLMSAEVGRRIACQQQILNQAPFSGVDVLRVPSFPPRVGVVARAGWGAA